MKQAFRALIAILVIVWASAITHKREKRQLITPTFRIGPNDETILVINGEDIVYLTGNQAMCDPIRESEMLIYGGGRLVLFPPRLSSLAGIESFWFLGEGSTELNLATTTGSDVRIGPGTLFSSSGVAFFTNDQRIINIITETKATAMPLRTIVEVLRRITETQVVSLLQIENGNFTMRLTGSPTKILDITTDNRIQYRGNTLTVQQGILETTEYPNIDMFAVFQLELDSTDTRYRVLFPGTSEFIRGPGQVYIGVDENRAFFVEEFSFRGGDRDVIGFINSEIFRQAFGVEGTDSGVDILDSANNKIITLTMNTSKFEIPNAAEVTYIGSQRLLVFRDRGGRVNSFPNVELFSIFENNTLRSFNGMSGVSMYFLCTGGTVFVDGSEALFASESNPFAISELCDQIPSIEGVAYSFDIVGDNEFRRLLRSIRINVSSILTTDEQQTPIQVVTGLYVTSVAEGEAVSFRDNAVLIRDFFDNTVTRIENVDRLYVNTESTPFRLYENRSPIPFHGPGTLTYSRGTAFFTTDRSLGRDLGFESRTAGVPDIDVELTRTNIVDINGENFTESTAILKIGGDRVLSFETSSFGTSSEQEILYANDMVTVHRPIFTGEGNVTYIGSTQTVMYTDKAGRTRNLTGVSSFQEFSGGEVETTTAADDTFVAGPGKIYVSEDGTSILFSSSNLITAETAGIIRRGATDLSLETDQFSSISGGVFNLSTNAATVTYGGGGLIYFSVFDGRREALYIDSRRVTNEIRTHVSALIPLTKSVAQEDEGIINLIFNGRSVYCYMPVAGNDDIVVSSTVCFVFNDTNITGLLSGSFTGIDKLVTYDGLQLKIFNESNTPVEMCGYGLLIVNTDSGTAFYTTLPFSVGLLSQTIKDLKVFLIPPEIRTPRNRQVTTKLLANEIQLGTDVRAFAGASIVFTCTARGRPTPEIEFFRETDDGIRTPLNESEMRVSVVNDSFTLSSISSDDSGTYGCRADNNVPPADVALSTLTVEEAVAPRLKAGRYPFVPQRNQSLFWPRRQGASGAFEVQAVKELVFACRVNGKPKADITWQFNDIGLQEASAIGLLNNSSFSILNFPNGRGVLIIGVEANRDILRGQNEIVCSAENAGGSTTGSITIEGIYYDCARVGEGGCSTTCGVGVRPIMYGCTVLQGGLTEDPISDDLVVVEALPFGHTEVCIVTDVFGENVICPRTDFRWNTTEWTECSRTCGGGSQQRTVSCVNISIPIASDHRAILDMAIETEANVTMCAMSESAGERPTARELCNTEDCPIWIAEEEFSECSVTCGVGVRTREVTCNIITGNYTDEFGDVQFNFTLVNSSLCDPDKQPLPSKVCKPFRCQYEWLPLQFGACGDVPLAEEFPHCRQRGFFCYNGDPNPRIQESERIINNSLCSDVTPAVSPLGSCGGGRCFNGIWRTVFTSPCSATCGCGDRTRRVECRSPLTRTLVDNSFCDIATRPLLEEKCLIRNCDNKCEGDEIRFCSIYKMLDMCDLPTAMGRNGLRCCNTCLEQIDEDDEPCVSY